MKKPIKKYPFLVSLIISFVIVVASIFVVAFCGLKLNPSLGGGSQFEISIADDANSKSYGSEWAVMSHLCNARFAIMATMETYAGREDFG